MSVVQKRDNRVHASHFLFQKRDSHAHAPRFPKPKDEGWFLVIGDVEQYEVLALKRVGYEYRNHTYCHLLLHV